MQEEIVKVIKVNMQASIIIADNLKNAQPKILSEFGEYLKIELLKRELELNYDVKSKILLQWLLYFKYKLA